MLALAPLLRLVHRNLLGAAAAQSERGARIADAQRVLGERAPSLSSREREVCARIALGLTADGVAADQFMRPSTPGPLDSAASDRSRDRWQRSGDQG